jgi:hypothetical protein
MGKWDKDTATYSRFEIMMQFMEAGIGCPDGPLVYGKNFSVCVEHIRVQMASVLGGTPSTEIVGAIVLALLRVKPFVEKLIKEDDPVTGGGSPDPPAARTEEFYVKLCEFCFHNEEKLRKKTEVRQQQERLLAGDIMAAGIINGPTRNSERAVSDTGVTNATTRQLFPATPTTRSRPSSTKNESESPTAFQIFLRDNAKAKMDRAAAATQLSDTHKRKTEVEIELLKQKQTESEFQFKMLQIEKLKETMDKFPAGSVPYQVMSKKIENLVKDL